MKKGILLSLLVLAGCLKYFGVFNVSTLTIEQHSDQMIAIRLSDMIISPISDELEALLKDLSVNKGVVLILNSPGGSVEEGEKIISLLQTQKERGLKINTVVENGAVCASMCIPIFMQGDRRYAGARSSFMLHGVFFGLERETAPDVDRTKNYISRLIQLGVSSNWLDHLWKQNIFTQSKEYWLNAEELVEQDSNIVTDLTPRNISIEMI